MELRDGDGELIDSVHSYTALRSVDTQADRFILNSRPYYLRLVLDQGYWLGSGLTAPDDEALIKDIGLVKQMGFNGVRKHQKIESSRFLYWADRLGLLVWEEMPSAYRYTKTRSIHKIDTRMAGKSLTTAIAAIPALWHGCPSTKVGEFRTFPRSPGAASLCPIPLPS